jgi:hypothetical protein
MPLTRRSTRNSPRPTPPTLRVVEASSWVKGEKMRSRSTSATPSPWSATSIRVTPSGLGDEHVDAGAGRGVLAGVADHHPQRLGVAVQRAGLVGRAQLDPAVGLGQPPVVDHLEQRAQHPPDRRVVVDQQHPPGPLVRVIAVCMVSCIGRRGSRMNHEALGFSP